MWGEVGCGWGEEMRARRCAGGRRRWGRGFADAGGEVQRVGAPRAPNLVADDGPAALEVFVSEEAVALPLQKSVQDHRREQLPFISDLKAISLVEIIIRKLLI